MVQLKVVTESVQGQAVRKLREAIGAGFFQPGDRLVEADLCNQLGISRASVREALRSLEARRLIEIVPNKGPIVPILTFDEAKQIYDVRALLEGEASALFSQRASKASLAAMRDTLRDFGDAIKSEDIPALIETTRRFYEQISTNCGNLVICEMLDGLLGRINFLRGKSMSQPGRTQQSMKEMQSLLRAIARRDAAAARAAAVYHVHQACETALRVFSAETSSSHG